MSDNSRRDDDAFEFDETLTEQPLAAESPTPVPDDETTVTSVRGPSRTTRILLAFLLLAVAAFLWYNYMYQPATPPATPLVSTPLPRTAPGSAQLNGNGNGAAAPLVAGQPPSDPAAVPAATDDTGQVVVVLPPPEVAGVMARELVITDLPFLVTEPPAADGTAEADAEAEIVRPTAQRASINPFSPVVLVTPDPQEFAGPLPDAVFADEGSATQPPAEQVTEVSIPSGPDQAAITTIAAPVTPPVVPPSVAPGQPSTPQAAPAAPPVAAQAVPVTPVPQAQTQAAAGSTPLAQSLPRPLPGPSMSHVPPVLQERRAVEDVPQPNLVQLAATEEPVPASESLPEAPSLPTADAGQDPLPPVASRVLPSDMDPLVAGITPLSRYLRDNDITFTGVVLGPISQGVFRSLAAERPLIVALGHQLPETEIVLTDLRGQEAEFTLADATQTITLDLRR